MTHMHIPTLPPFERVAERVTGATPSTKHRADIAPHDVLALDLLAERINHRPKPRRAARKHIDTTMPVDATRTNAACTGGLVNAYGVTLTRCRSSYCPRHAPGSYTDARAKHATDSL